MNQISGWDKVTSPFHRGEQELHERLGIKDRMDSMSRRIHRPFMVDQHQEFYAQLPFFIAGSVDANGGPWASILFGEPGFITTPTDRKLLINARPISGDPLAENAVSDSPVSFLGIELSTRRRNRLNGVVATQSDNALAVDIVQSYGNCPQYIQTRSMAFVRDPNEQIEIEAERFETLDNDAVQMIRTADTLFVASHNNEDDIYDTGGVDVNHRGGQPGFVKVEGNTLTIPDYMGNFAFNTLGNFMINPKAGILFVDFETGDLLMLTGTTELLWDMTPELQAFRGAERAWRFTLDHGFRLKNASPLRWTFGEYAPTTLMTGKWE